MGLQKIVTQLYRDYRNRGKFDVAQRLVEGRHHTRSQQPSILHFSVNKAATQYVKNLLRAVGPENNLHWVGLNELAFNSNIPYFDHMDEETFKQYAQVFKPQGYCYSVFGGLVRHIPDMENYKILLVVRDPRDILVSEFFSTAYSHPAPAAGSKKRDTFLENREKAIKTGIDGYVLEQAPALANTFDNYRKGLLDKYPDARLLKYETLATDFNLFLNQLLDACGCTLKPATLKRILEIQSNAKPKQEDVKSHNRKGVVGDFREKIKEETITALEGIFARTLVDFGYTPGVQATAISNL